MQKKILIAMSGGVDSSTAAFLMREGGFDCSGAMMKLCGNKHAEACRDMGCGTIDDTEDARNAAAALGIPFYVFDFSDRFAEEIIRRFIRAYLGGATPNPCVDCNRHIKFGLFLSRAREMGMDFAATGHYARAEFDEGSGRYLLKKAVDDSKDQSYVLYSLKQDQLAMARFPLGGLCKSEVREIALREGFVNPEKPESQDICFVPDGDYAKFIEKYAGIKPERGPFVDSCGNVLGEHRGIIHYTIGQRRGLGLPASEPLYVREIRPETNTVVVGTNDELFSKTLTARDINLIPVGKLDSPIKALAKIRYRHREVPATIRQTGPDTLHIAFETPQRAVTKGQAVVLYDGDTVIGGGTIA